MSTRNNSLSIFNNNQSKYLERLDSFLRIPSISTDPEHARDVNQAANFLADELRAMGIENVQVFPTPRHPVVYGDYIHAGPSQPTILVYGHYDVQPVDPLDLWKSDPFSPVIRQDNLYARGASDMKGQVYACIAAIDSILLAGDFPVNLKFLYEGEEEIGSPNLKAFMLSHQDLLKSDVSLNPDTGMVGVDMPTIVYGLRGLSYFEVHVYGPDRDLHSGIYGGAVHNPAQVLADLIAKMHDKNGRVQLPGFYDQVKELSQEERFELNKIGHDESYYKTQTGTPALWGESGYTPVEQIGARPTLEVNGILSGFVGEGSKTIIPSKAMAKISTRLVPNQDPNAVYGQLVKFMELNAPETVKWEVKLNSVGSPSISDINMPETKALYQALKTVWGVDPIYKREGGSVPVVAEMQEYLGIDSVLTGFGLPDDNVHSPNEKLHLPTWKKGVEALIHFFHNAKRD
jgi:acetylornithine deacetylase/succinyl-diaminopimelate desuccinylase-like protein